MNRDEIFVIYGSSAFENTYTLLKRLDIASEINPNARIGIKPNLVVSQRSELGATTDPNIVAGIVAYLKDNGHNNIVILESAWVGDNTKRAFEVCGYNDIAKKYNVELLDLKSDKSIKKDAAGMELSICATLDNLDYLINVPVLKGHCQTRMTCALKNLKGCIPDSEKRRYHTLGIHKPVAHLNTVIKTNLVIVDGIYGDLDFEEGGTPINMNRIVACADPVMLDAYICDVMGVDVNNVEYILLAQQLGVGVASYDKSNIVELNTNEKLPIDKKHKYITFDNVFEKDSCSACYASLIHAMTRYRKARSMKHKICIGQAYKGQSMSGAVGIGQCCGKFEQYVKGCPPTGSEIIAFLENL